MKKPNKLLPLLGMLLFFVVLPFQTMAVHAAIPAMNASDQAVFDSALTPVYKVVNFARYFFMALTIGVAIFVAISMLITDDIRKKDELKGKLAMVVIACVVVYAAPTTVTYLMA